MIAVIEVGGNQYIVKKGDVIVVDRLDETVDTHTFSPLMIAGEDVATQVGSPTVKGASVMTRVRAHTRGDKVRVFKMKSKKHYRRTQGFRAAQTELVIESINA